MLSNINTESPVRPYPCPQIAKIFIVKNYLSNWKCDELINFYKSKEPYKEKVFDSEMVNNSKDHGKAQWKEDTRTRDTWTIDTGEEWWEEQKIDVVMPYMQQYLMPYFSQFPEFEEKRKKLGKSHLIDGCEPLHYLEYSVGGHYLPHVDAWAEYFDGEKTYWRQNVNRDFSSLYYLNDDFEGGCLEFPKFNLVLEPEKGMVVSFPSTYEFLHGVRPVTKGIRYTLVNWSTMDTDRKL